MNTDGNSRPINFSSTLSSGEENATDITTLADIETINSINGSDVTDINGTITQINAALTVLEDEGNSRPTNFSCTLSAGTEVATDITALADNNGTGTINGSALTAINGTATAVVQAYYKLDEVEGDDGFTRPTAFSSTLSAGAEDATDITTLADISGITINGQHLPQLTVLLLK